MLVEYQRQKHVLPVVVVAGKGPSLFGQNWLEKLVLDWSSIKSVQTELGQLLTKHEAVFRPELGTMKGIQAHLDVESTAQPKFHKPRPVPYALRTIEQELKRLEETAGVLKRVAHADWAAPIVPVPKPDGSVRICGDYKVTVHPVLRADQ